MRFELLQASDQNFSGDIPALRRLTHYTFDGVLETTVKVVVEEIQDYISCKGRAGRVPGA
jgi:hypothetical protein